MWDDSPMYTFNIDVRLKPISYLFIFFIYGHICIHMYNDIDICKNAYIYMNKKINE